MRLLRLGFALIAILAGCSAAAAQQTPNLSEIATALTEERAQIVALRAELERYVVVRRIVDSVGSPGIVDHEEPRAVCLTTQNIRVAARQFHGFAI